jgi:PleD family two-component response regulator
MRTDKPGVIVALLGQADAAMYQAKATGRNQVCFHAPTTGLSV